MSSPGLRDAAGSTEDQDKRFSGDHADRASRLQDAESQGSQSSGSGEATQQEVSQREASGSSGDSFVSNFSGTDAVTKTIGFKKPAAGVGIVLGVFGLSSVMLSPALILQAIASPFSGKFNSQTGWMKRANTKRMEAKLSDKTKGYCGKKVTIKCKFSSMSKREVKQLEKAGFQVRGKKGKLGRIQVERLVFVSDTGEKVVVDAKNYRDALKNNPKFGSMMRAAHKTKLAGLADKVAQKKLQLFKAARKPIGAAASSLKDRSEKFKKYVLSGVSPSLGTRPSVDSSGNEEEKKRSERVKKVFEKIESVQKKLSPTGVGGVLGKVGSGALKTVSITGGLDNICTFYSMVKIVSSGAKIIRVARMVRYASVFLALAHQIKASEGRSGDAEWAGKILTDTYTEKDTGRKIGAATDSSGLQFAINGFPYKSNELATLAFAGVGFTGKLDKALSIVHKVVASISGKKTRKEGKDFLTSKCKLVTHPVSRGLALAVSVVVAVGTLGTATLASVATNAGIAIVTTVASIVLPGLIIDLLAGKGFDPATTRGEYAGNYIASGAMALTQSTASAGGGLAMTPGQYSAYYNSDMRLANQHERTISRYEARNEPFNINNEHSIAGRVVHSYFAQSVRHKLDHSSVLAFVTSFTRASAKSIQPSSVYAANNPSDPLYPKEAFSQCEDPGIEDLGVATDPFCNPMYGQPDVGLSAIQLTDFLLERKLIDKETGAPKGRFEKWAKGCTERTVAIGETTEEDKTYGDECLVNGSERLSVYFANYLALLRTEDIAEEGFKASNNTSATQEGTAAPEFKKLGTVTDCPSDPEIEDLGTIKTKYNSRGMSYPEIRLCRIKNITGGGEVRDQGHQNKGAVVNAHLAAAWHSLAKKAKEQGVQLNANNSFRYPDSCGGTGDGSDCAKPGTSNHQLGAAIDFELSDKRKKGSTQNCNSRSTSNDPQWKFLNENAPAVGIKQYSFENWHWDADKGANRCPQ